MAEGYAGFEPLTGREADVLACLVQDLSNHEIAEQLFLSPSTVKWYVRQLNAKLNASNRKEIVDRARSLGLLEADKSQSVAAKHNLPYQTTPFIGRDAELDEAAQILARPDCRLLTVLAPGGMGKSRLALEAAEQQLHNFRDGVYFVPLQPLADVEQVIPAIAQHIGFQFAQDARPLKQQLLGYLGGKQMLLLIDNWEHLLDGALLVTEILQAAPGVKVLATSREKLNLSGETVYGLRGMQFPAWETPQDALRYDAVKLLVQAARRVQPDFEVTADNLDFIARICSLTEGMPLGILLATSWLDTLSLERIADEIVRNQDFLETEMRDVSARHRSLRAVLEAAWERLKPDEQQVFMKLSVFRGGCTLDAAEAVAGAAPRTMQSLVNKAFLLRTRTGRYEIHELLRQYGYKRLETSGALPDVLRQHSSYFAGFLHAKENDLKGGRQFEALDEIGAEIDNIRQGWYQALQDEQIAPIEQSLASLGTYVAIRSRPLEFLPLFADAERLLRPRYAADLGFATLLINYGGVLSQFRPYNEIDAAVFRPALAIARAHDDRPTLALGYVIMTSSGLWLDRPDEALAFCEEAVRIFERSGAEFEWGVALFVSGYVNAVNGNHDQGVALTRQALEIHRRVGNEIWIGEALHNIAIWAYYAGRFDEAEPLFHEVLAIRRRFKQRQGISNTLLGVSDIEFQKGSVDAARTYAEESLRIAQDIAVPPQIARSLLVLATLDIASDRFDEAEQKTADVLKLGIVEVDALRLLTKALARLGLNDVSGAKDALLASLRQKTGQEFFGLAPMALLGMGLVAAGEGQPERGLELVSLALNDPRMQGGLVNSRVVTTRLEAIRNQLSESAYAAAWERGRALDMKATVSELLQAPDAATS